MKNHKYKLILSVICLLIVIIFNLAFWTVLHYAAVQLTSNIILSYVFLLLSIIITCSSLFGFTFRRHDAFIYTTPIFMVSLGYLLLQFGLTLTIIFFSKLPLLLMSITQTILLLAYGIFILLIAMGLLYTSDHQSKTRMKINFINDLRLVVDKCLLLTNEPVLVKALEDLQEQIKYSDPMSSALLAQDEEVIANKIHALTILLPNSELEVVTKVGYISEVQKLLIIRNKQCQTLKK